MPVYGTSTVTVTAALQTGVNLNFTVVDPVDNYPVPINTQENYTFKSGGGATSINVGCTALITLPASGSTTINLNTGATSGSYSIPLTLPATGGATFSTTGLNLLEVDLYPGGSQTVTLTPAASNGFGGPILGSGSVTCNGSNSALVGGSLRWERSDSIGWPVSSSKCNLIIANNDSGNAATFTLTLAGQ